MVMIRRQRLMKNGSFTVKHHILRYSMQLSLSQFCHKNRKVRKGSAFLKRYEISKATEFEERTAIGFLPAARCYQCRRADEYVAAPAVL